MRYKRNIVVSFSLLAFGGPFVVAHTAGASEPRWRAAFRSLASRLRGPVQRARHSEKTQGTFAWVRRVAPVKVDRRLPEQSGGISREQVADLVRDTVNGGRYPGEQIAALIDLVRQNSSDREAFRRVTAEVIKAALGGDGKPGIRVDILGGPTFFEFFLRGRQPTHDGALMGRLMVEILDTAGDLLGRKERNELKRQILGQIERPDVKGAVRDEMFRAVRHKRETRERIDYRDLARTPDEMRDHAAMASSMARNIETLNRLPVVTEIVELLRPRESEVRSSGYFGDVFTMPSRHEVGVSTSIPGLYVTVKGLRSVGEIMGYFEKPGSMPFEWINEPKDLIGKLEPTLRTMRERPPYESYQARQQREKQR